MDWFRRRHFHLYSSLEENASIELTEQNAEKTLGVSSRETERVSIQETREFAPGNSTSYGSLKKETELCDAKLTTWQASWNITNMIQVPGNSLLMNKKKRFQKIVPFPLNIFKCGFRTWSKSDCCPDTAFIYSVGSL